MGKPQQPELDRSGRSPVDQDSARNRTGRPSAGRRHGTDRRGRSGKGGKGGGEGGGVPPDQRPDHPA